MPASQNALASITLRAAQPADEPALAQIFLDARRQAFPWRETEQFALEDFARETEGEQVFVAEDERGEILGFISVWAPQSFIHHLYVAPRHQRRGVGHRLVQHLVGQIDLPFQLKCVSRNQPALDFYMAHGWRDVGTGRGIDGQYKRLQWDGP